MKSRQTVCEAFFFSAGEQCFLRTMQGGFCLNEAWNMRATEPPVATRSTISIVLLRKINNQNNPLVGEKAQRWRTHNLFIHLLPDALCVLLANLGQRPGSTLTALPIQSQSSGTEERREDIRPSSSNHWISSSGNTGLHVTALLDPAAFI